MKKIIFWFLLFCLPIVTFADDGQPISITLPQNWVCIEDNHVWTNDCTKVFDNITNATNYFQASTGTGHYVWFSFYSEKQIVRYWIINSNNDITFNITAFRFQAYVNGSWVDLDTKNPYTVISGKWVYTEIASPVYAKQYRIYIDSAWVDGALISEIQMFDAISIAEADQYFTEDEIEEIAIVEMVATLIFWVIAFGLNLKNIV